MSKVERLERIEGGRGYAKEFTTKLGEKLGWMDGATMYTKKIGNTELMGITAFDDKFTAQHNRMAELLEAYYKFRGKYIDESSSLDIAEIYEGVERKQPIKVSVRASAGAEMREMDIKEIARLLRMKQLNSFLGKYAIPEKTLEETFFAGGELVVNISSDDGEEGREIDFYKMCPMDSMEDFDFEGYLKNIRKNQIGLQWMGNIRDEALQKHHIENAGHSLFKKINRVKTLTGHDEHLWIPVCETLAKENARGDLQKTDTSFKAGGHVHEFVQYNEDTGASVKIEFDLIQKHRAGIDYRSFQKTLPRTYKAAVGMTQNEFASVTEELVEFGESDKKETKKLKIFDIGANGGGDIYKGMRSTYDRGTKAVRGFSLSKDEIDDRILTDIIGPWVTNNANDWLMCLAQSINGSINYDILKAVSKGGGDWEKNFGFCVRIRCKNNNGEVEPRNFRSVHELIDYINQRIKKARLLVFLPERVCLVLLV